MHEGDSGARSGPSPCSRGRGRRLRTVTWVPACLIGFAGPAMLVSSASATVSRAHGQGAVAHFVHVGTAPELSSGAHLLGSLPGSKELSLDIALRPRDPEALASFVSEVSTPGSPDYRRYLAPGVFGSRFGATTRTLRSTVVALGRLGLHVRQVSSNHLMIEAYSSVAAAERAFHTELDRYRLASGAEVYANRSAPLIPASLAGGIQAIAGLEDLSLARPSYVRGGRSARKSSSARSAPANIDVPGGPSPCAAADKGAAATGPYTADEIASAYGFSDLYASGDFGAGQTIGVFELEPFDAPNVRTYDECYFGTSEGEAMSSPPHLNVVTVDSSEFIPGINDDVEATLDVEEVSGFLPQATIDVYEGPNTSTGPLDVYDTIVSQDKAKVITTSWGACEVQAGGSGAVAAEANLFEEAAAQGQTIVAASGDDGSSDCTDPGGYPVAPPAVDDPGSQPYVTSVGGTELALGSLASANASALEPREKVWNSNGGASGGGISSDWAMPAYQLYAAPGLHVVKSYSSRKPCGAPTGECREVPDVSADAAPDTGLMIYWSGWGGWSYVGGTSISAPLWAVVAALANSWPSCGAQLVGFLNPSLYWIAGMSPSIYASNFMDIKSGDNHLAQFSNWWQYPATVGYDLASGLGAPIASNGSGGGLVPELCSLPESGGALYASPTRSSVKAVLRRVKAKATASSWIKVTLRTAAGLPIADKRVILVGNATSSSADDKKIRPAYETTNTKGVAVFQVSDTSIQKVTYYATDLTDGVQLAASATVSYIEP